LPRLCLLGFSSNLISTFDPHVCGWWPAVEDTECFLAFQRSCLVRWCPPELLGPGANHKTGFGAPLRLEELVSHSYAGGRLGLVFVVFGAYPAALFADLVRG